MSQPRPSSSADGDPSARSGVSPGETVPHFIAGRRVAGGSSQLPVFDPSRGVEQRRVGIADRTILESAIAAAENALPDWAARPALQRARVLKRFGDELARRSDELAALISSEHGKTQADARGEIQRGLEVVEFATGAPQLLKGEISESIGSGLLDSWAIRQPLGVVAGVTPFNFPVMVPLWMIPMALACGNAFILKPSERDPSASVLLAELLADAGLPAGVLTVLQGDRTVVDMLIDHPAVQAVSFVGSTPVARAIYERASLHGKRVQALGGAKNHLVVLPDADLDTVAEALVGAAFGSAGERCMAVSVAVAVGAATADALAAKLAQRIRALTIGCGVDPLADMGPLISAEHLARVRDLIASGVAEGATLLVDGRERSVPQPQGGYFLGGSLFDHVRPGMRIYDEEIFGPVLCMMRADDAAEALTIVNANRYGNGASIFTRDGGRARAFAGAVTAGMVGINVAIPVPMAFHSFGGWKQSLFGAHGMHGLEGVRFYTRLKTVVSRWPQDAAERSSFTMPVVS